MKPNNARQGDEGAPYLYVLRPPKPFPGPCQAFLRGELGYSWAEWDGMGRGAEPQRSGRSGPGQDGPNRAEPGRGAPGSGTRVAAASEILLGPF